MNIGSHPNIELGGEAEAADAMTAYVRLLVKPPADRKHHRAVEPKMPLVTSISTANINGSKWPLPTPPHCLAQSRSPRAGTAAQIP